MAASIELTIPQKAGIDAAQVILPVRSRQYGVGKDIGGAVYIHRNYEQLLGELIQRAKEHVPIEFDYVVVKYRSRSGTVSFIESPDFDTVDEPTVGDAYVVHADGTTLFVQKRADPYIYHHKWLFVADDYPGFNVAASKARSSLWTALPGIDRSRIGCQSYWRVHILPRLEPPQA